MPAPKKTAEAAPSSSQGGAAKAAEPKKKTEPPKVRSGGWVLNDKGRWVLEKES